ncbi:hypothetical protein CIB84_017477, partial [Bambusicola thoracicus]
MGPCWAAELVPPWQLLPGVLGFSVLCCTLPLHFHYLSVKAMLWISSSVKSPTSSSSPAQNPTSGKLGLVRLVCSVLVLFGCFAFILFSYVQ